MMSSPSYVELLRRPSSPRLRFNPISNVVTAFLFVTAEPHGRCLVMCNRSLGTGWSRYFDANAASWAHVYNRGGEMRSIFYLSSIAIVGAAALSLFGLL
jgi:hypothetical protein